MSPSLKKSRSFQDQWLGHVVTKFFALGTNICALILAIMGWEFGDHWDKLLFHAVLGMLPVHIVAIACILVISRHSREMSIIHDHLCTTVCLTGSTIVYLIISCQDELALFLLMTAVILIFDLMIHEFTED